MKILFVARDTNPSIMIEVSEKLNKPIDEILFSYQIKINPYMNLPWMVYDPETEKVTHKSDGCLHRLKPETTLKDN